MSKLCHLNTPEGVLKANTCSRGLNNLRITKHSHYEVSSLKKEFTFSLRNEKLLTNKSSLTRAKYDVINSALGYLY